MFDHTDTAAEAATTPGVHAPDSDLITDAAGPAEDSAADGAADLAQDQGPGDSTDPAEDQAGCELPWCGSVPLAGRVTSRLVMPVEWLTAHPGNVRADLDLDPEFLASVAENGVLVPLRITVIGDGDGDAAGYRVIDGHRRLAAAVKAGQAEVPYDLVTERQADEAGQYLDMYNAHHHRKGLRPEEEADALFAASTAGASRTRIRKATGLKAGQVKAALAAATLTGETRAAVAGADYDLNLEDLAILAEFQDDPEALGQLLNAAGYSDSLEHHAARLRLEREEQAAHERLRAELEAGGLTLTGGLPIGAQLLASLRHDGEPLTAEAHAGCPGRAAYFRSYDLVNPVHYCAGPDEYGHAPMWESPAAGIRSGASGPATPDPGGPASADESEAEREAAAAARRLVIAGNRAWTAAADVRWRWLAGQLFARRTAPREAAPFVARQLLTMPGALRSGLDTAHASIQGSEITGRGGDGWLELCDSAAAGRLPLLMLAPLVIAYERALTEGTGRDTWRPGRYTVCSYADAGRYFTFLASVGYDLSAIERSVASQTPYTGDAPAGGPLITRLADDTGPGDGAGDVPRDVPGGQDVSAGTDSGEGPALAAA
jgi:ParB family chromosome partitioning protein